MSKPSTLGQISARRAERHRTETFAVAHVLGYLVLTSSDLTLRLGCEMVYQAPGAIPALVCFKPLQGKTQRIREERFHFEPNIAGNEFQDEHGNVVYRIALQPGSNLLRYDAIVKVPSEREDAHYQDGVTPVGELVPSVLRYTLPSRYVDSDKLGEQALALFGHLRPGLDTVLAVADWTHQQIEYRTGSGDPTLSAKDVLDRGYGVCRDMAHVAMAFCRALNLPVRYVSGYLPDVGVVDPGTPGDFHAYFEVFLANRWQAFDARHNAPRIGRVRLAAGYDAGSCAITTLFGLAELKFFEVWTYQIDPRDASTHRPVDLARRLDGTEYVRFRG